LYKFETLVPFEVLPLRLDAAIPAPLPILETLSKIFNGNSVKGRQRFACRVQMFLTIICFTELCYYFGCYKSHWVFSETGYSSAIKCKGRICSYSDRSIGNSKSR